MKQAVKMDSATRMETNRTDSVNIPPHPLLGGLALTIYVTSIRLLLVGKIRASRRYAAENKIALTALKFFSLFFFM